MTWVEPANNGFAIKARFRSPGSGTFGAERLVHQVSSLTRPHPVLAMSKWGSFVVVWDELLLETVGGR